VQPPLVILKPEHSHLALRLQRPGLLHDLPERDVPRLRMSGSQPVSPSRARHRQPLALHAACSMHTRMHAPPASSSHAVHAQHATTARLQPCTPYPRLPAPCAPTCT
jgi:hypothetical protein